ncbi:MAG: DNA mismatch repair protein MutL [Chlamydiia bacterium]|nr:DNA mismatch repair protein MutL [Chlamydiia bacterium]
MSSRVKVLDDKTINQIAAGEVIESPTSVVKELIDNALDAGAKRIRVEIKAGGFHLIQISDDGAGMSGDDAVLSLERHATSKISKLQDLLSVKSMGFRGEALASIASISKFTMITALENKDHVATRVVVEGGKIQTVGPFSREKGTTIEVRSLFYCVPARKKFQKSVGASSAEITRMISKVALARPDVSFSLFSNDKLALSTDVEKGASFEDCLFHTIEKTLGDEVAKNIIPIHLDDPYMKIEGFIGTPLLTRQNRLLQHLFINSRVVESIPLSLAALDGYSTMIGAKRYPAFVLHITMDPKELDVNVHPQKKEVRFKDETRAKNLLRKAVAEALRKEPAAPNVHVDPFETRGEVFEILEDKMLEKSDLTFERQNFFPQEELTEELIPFSQPMLAKVADFSVVGLYKSSVVIDASSCEDLIKLPDTSPPYRGLFFIDLKKAAERLYIDSCMKRNMEKLSLQKLLFPKTLSFSKEEMITLCNSLDMFAEIGVEMRPFSETKMIVEGVSDLLEEEKLESFIHEALHNLSCNDSLDEDVEKIRESLSIKAAACIKTQNAFYTKEIAKKVVSDLLKSTQPYYSPDGSKIVAYLKEDMYDKLFTKASY